MLNTKHVGAIDLVQGQQKLSIDRGFLKGLPVLRESQGAQEETNICGAPELDLRREGVRTCPIPLFLLV